MSPIGLSFPLKKMKPPHISDPNPKKNKNYGHIWALYIIGKNIYRYDK